jgi:hypothetical protein
MNPVLVHTPNAAIAMRKYNTEQTGLNIEEGGVKDGFNKLIYLMIVIT